MQRSAAACKATFDEHHRAGLKGVLICSSAWGRWETAGRLQRFGGLLAGMQDMNSTVLWEHAAAVVSSLSRGFL